MREPSQMPASASDQRPIRRQLNVPALLWRAVTYLVLFCLMLLILTPFLWLVTSSLRPVSELFVTPPRWIPSRFNFDGYVKAFGIFALPILNSIFYGICTAVISLLVACPAAYSLTRFKYKGKRWITSLLLLTQMLPFVLLLLPLYIAYIKIGLYNTRLGMIIGFTALTIPYSILLLRGYFATLPADLEEQAQIDGCTRLGALWKVVLPLSRPVLMAVILSDIVLVWNDVLFNIFLTRDISNQTASVALYMFYTLRWQSGGVGQKEVMLAGGVLLTLPVVLLFIFLQKYLVKGLTVGALKA